MADKNYVVSLTVDDSGAVAAVNQMTTALDRADNSTQSLKAQLREMQAQLANLDPNTDEFRKLSVAAGEVKDKIKDASEAISAQAGPAFETLGNNAALLKQRLFSLDFEGVGQSVKALAGNVNNLNFGNATKGLSSLTSGFASLGKALLTNPIILIGSVLALIITNLDKLANAIPLVGKAFEVVGNVIGKVVQGFKDLTDWIGLTENAAVDAANKSIDLQDQTIKDIERNAKRQVAIAKQLGQDVNQATIEAEQKKLETYQKTIDDIDKLTGKLTDEQIKARQAASDAIFDIETARIERQAEQNQKDIAEKEAREKKAQEEANKRAEEAAKKEQERRQKEKEQREFEAQFIAELYAEQDAQIEANNKALADRLTAIWQRANELSRAAQQTQSDEIKDIQDELDVYLDEKGKSEQELELQRLQDNYFEKKTLLENAGEDTATLTEKYNQQVADINQKYYDEEIALAEQKKQKQFELINSGLNALVALNNAFEGKTEAQRKKAFNRNKALQIAQTLATTYQSATTAYASQIIPLDPTSPVRGAIAAGIAIAAGLANVAKISQQKYDGGGSQSAGGGGGGNVPSLGGDSGGNVGTVPTFNALNLGVLQNRPDQTVKSYVLAQDVSSAVEARDKVRDLARIN